MSQRMRRRRMVLFSAVTLIVATALGATTYFKVRDRLTVDAWTDYLGENEQRTLSRVINPAYVLPEDDRLLRIPGLAVQPGESMRTSEGERVVFQTALTPTQSPVLALAGIRGFWLEQGLPVEPQSGGLTVKLDGGKTTYLAMRDAPGYPGITLWRIQRNNTALGQRSSAWPSESAGLFPALPADAEALELGRPGQPGYQLMVNLKAPAAMAFKALRSDLLGRGWEPFVGGQSRHEDPRGRLFSETYRHPQVPLGCQLLVTADAGQWGGSRVLISIF